MLTSKLNKCNSLWKWNFSFYLYNSYYCEEFFINSATSFHKYKNIRNLEINWILWVWNSCFHLFFLPHLLSTFLLLRLTNEGCWSNSRGFFFFVIVLLPPDLSQGQTRIRYDQWKIAVGQERIARRTIVKSPFHRPKDELAIEAKLSNNVQQICLIHLS